MLPILHDTVAATRYGGQDFQQALQAGETDFTDPDYVASIEVVDQLKPYLPQDVVGVAYTDAQTLFTTGRAAMFAGGSFELGFFRAQAPDMEIGVFSVPPPPESPVDTPLVPGWADGSWGVNTDSLNKEAALDLVRWMATQEFGQMFTDELGQISGVPGTEPTDEVLAEIVTAYGEHPAPYLLLVDYRYGEPLGTDLMGEGMQELLLGDATPADVAKKVDEGISQWFEPQGG
jgi:raffinose/stachyose/melibiose transport system substrate-binding protein